MAKAEATVKVDGYKNKRIRIAILKALKAEYPGSIDIKVLQFYMETYGYPLLEEDLQAHLSYLKEKGYLSVNRKKGRGFDIMHVTMTALGWDLYDGIEQDKGIDAEL